MMKLNNNKTGGNSNFIKITYRFTSVTAGRTPH